jgi:hypothetical protein
VTVSLLAGISLITLPFAKGGFIGLLYHVRVTRRDSAIHTADQAD